jgi:ABC-type uncharacterized transport system involved in gliding motility auxiliary subunit
MIDPQPFSEQEDEAARFGLPSVPVRGAEDGIFLGLAATNSVDDEEIIPFSIRTRRLSSNTTWPGWSTHSTIRQSRSSGC